MALSQNSLSALDTWLKVETWYTGDVRDEHRFFGFVLAVWENGDQWDEAEFRETTRRKVREFHAGFDEEHLQLRVGERRSLATNILDFLKYKQERESRQ